MELELKQEKKKKKNEARRTFKLEERNEELYRQRKRRGL